MAAKLRLARAGTHKRPYYWVVAADQHMPRDGRFLEKLGIYNPRTKPTTVDLKLDRIAYWLDKGAEPTEPVREILRGQGVLKARAAAKAAAKKPAEPESPGAASE